MICKVCKVKLTSENTYKTNNFLCKADYRAYKRAEYQKSKDKKITRVKQYQATEKGKQVQRDTAKRMYYKDPKRKWARTKLNDAVKYGKIIKPDKCERFVDGFIYKSNCEGRLEAHHYLGYGAHWKDVQWLCKKHHVEAHRE